MHNMQSMKKAFFGHSYGYEGSEHCITNVKFEPINLNFYQREKKKYPKNRSLNGET